MRVLIIGGSVGGLFAANLLHRIGCDVTVFERAADDLTGRGAGLGTRPELATVLRRIGIAWDHSITVQVRSRVGLHRSGNIICELPVASVVTAWDRIFRALVESLPRRLYRRGKALVAIEQDGAGVTAHFADGYSAQGDLLVAADGIWSTVRRLFLPDLTPRYAGYVGWRGVAEEETIPVGLRELLLHHMTFAFPPGELVLGVPMAPAGNADWAGGLRAQFSWFRPTDAARLADLCTDANGRCHGVSIPPPLIRSELIANLRAEASARLPPQLASLVAQGSPLVQPICDLESSSLVFGRVVLLGDAGFVARPHVGTGVTKAALDAQCLTDALLSAGDDFGAALRCYDDERLRFGRDLVARGRYLGEWLSAWQEAAPDGVTGTRMRDPVRVMREFGAAGEVPHGVAAVASA